MRDGNEGRDTATADGSISSVFGLAILRIQEFFDLNQTKMAALDSTDTKYYSTFCDRHATKRGLGKRGSMIILSDTDLDGITLDVQEGHKVLAGIRACRFVVSLLSWPGVKEAIADAGGWTKVESFAKKFVECGLVQAYPDEKHFVLLSDVQGLREMLSQDSKELKAVEEKCENSLRQLWKRFRCGTSKKEILKRNPGIKTIQAALKAGKETCFPDLDRATEWE
jgi:hypothetical protein